MDRIRVCSVFALALALVLAVFGSAQVITGGITGRALDASGALLPGVEVTITSPAMIGGGRNAVTDEQGSYRFTALVPGTYRVSFDLPGFNVLNIDGVDVGAGTTMSINGVIQVAAVAQEVTVTSETPTIDLESATVGVNWGLKSLEDLPSGKSLPSLVGMIPGLYATQYDVGASTMGGTAAPPARAYGRNGGNVTTYDGMVWDQTFGDFGSYDEVQVLSAAKGAESTNPGATFNFVIKSGSNDFHGSFLASWQDDKFQSNNVNQKLLDRGLAATSNKYTRYNDFKGNFGGPIKRDKLWFFTSYTDSYSGQYISGFISEKTGQPAVFYTRVNGPTLKLTYQPSPKTKFDLVEQLTWKYQPYRGADQFKPLEATESQDFLASVGPSLKWSYFATPRVTMDAGISRSGYWWTTYGWTSDVRKTDQITSQIRGANIKQYRRPIRWQWNGNVSWFAELAGKNHEIKSGVLGYWDKNFTENLGYPNQQIYRYRSQAGETNYFLHPDSVQVFDYPNFTASGVSYESWYVNDKITWNRKLTLNAGVRFDHYASWLPEQGNPGTGPFATKNLYPERHDFPVYNKWVPRLSMAYDLFGDGRLALKASYGRYVGAGSGPGASPGPGASNVNPAAAITRTYNNWDGTIPYVPVAANLASTSGGGGIQQLDSNLVTPYMDEYTAAAEIGLSRNYVFRLNVVRKMDFGGNTTLDRAQPYEAYTDVRSAIDPGRDNVAGTPDDGVMYAWSVPRTYPTFGQVNTLITNVGKDEAKALYTAYETTFSRRYANGWSVLISGSADFAKLSNKTPQNPNAAIYNWQYPSWNYGIKMNGTYDLPWGVSYASTYRAQSGEYYGRSAQMRNALNSTVTVLVEGRVGRYNWVKLWDNRFSKTFQFNDTHSIEAMFDVYNTLNSSEVLAQVNTNGPDYLKPSTGSSSAATATAILPPRIFALGARWKF